MRMSTMTDPGEVLYMQLPKRSDKSDIVEVEAGTVRGALLIDVERAANSPKTADTRHRKRSRHRSVTLMYSVSSPVAVSYGAGCWSISQNSAANKTLQKLDRDITQGISSPIERRARSRVVIVWFFS